LDCWSVRVRRNRPSSRHVCLSYVIMKEDIKYILEYFSIKYDERNTRHGDVLWLEHSRSLPLWRACWDKDSYIEAGTDLLQDLHGCLTDHI
jgi:hypothetical protein